MFKSDILRKTNPEQLYKQKTISKIESLHYRFVAFQFSQDIKDYINSNTRCGINNINNISFLFHGEEEFGSERSIIIDNEDKLYLINVDNGLVTEINEKLSIEKIKEIKLGLEITYLYLINEWKIDEPITLETIKEKLNAVDIFQIGNELIKPKVSKNESNSSFPIVPEFFDFVINKQNNYVTIFDSYERRFSIHKKDINELFLEKCFTKDKWKVNIGHKELTIFGPKQHAHTVLVSDENVIVCPCYTEILFDTKQEAMEFIESIEEE